MQDCGYRDEAYLKLKIVVDFLLALSDNAYLHPLGSAKTHNMKLCCQRRGARRFHPLQSVAAMVHSSTPMRAAHGTQFR